jgi:hypothetical protein
MSRSSSILFPTTIPSLAKTSQAVVEFWKWEYMSPPFLAIAKKIMKRKHIYSNVLIIFITTRLFLRHLLTLDMEKVSIRHDLFQAGFLGQGWSVPHIHGA